MSYKIEYAEERLRAATVIVERAKKLGHIPLKHEFTESEVQLIKKHFGPLPRAMEAVGLKDVSESHIRKLRKKKKSSDHKEPSEE